MTNKIFITGNLGSKPGSETVNGLTKQKFVVAVNKHYLDNNHQRQQTTQWFKVYYWGKTKLEKGSQVFIEGRVSYDEKGKGLINADTVQVFT